MKIKDLDDVVRELEQFQSKVKDIILKYYRIPSNNKIDVYRKLIDIWNDNGLSASYCIAIGIDDEGLYIHLSNGEQSIPTSTFTKFLEKDNIRYKNDSIIINIISFIYDEYLKGEIDAIIKENLSAINKEIKHLDGLTKLKQKLSKMMEGDEK